MGKELPPPAPNMTKDEYLKVLKKYKETYWDFLKPKRLKKRI